MSKIAIAAVLCLTAAFFFGLGYQTGYEPPPPKEYQPLPEIEQDRQLTGVAAEVRDILRIADPLERTAKLASLLQNQPASCIAAVRDGYDSVFNDIQSVELRLLAQWWARLDPQSAFRWSIVEWAGSSVLTEVIRAWASRDPQAAKSAVHALRVNPVRFREAAQALAVGWDASGQPGLGEYMSSMTSGANRQRVIGLITRRKVLRDGIEETTRWVEGLPEDEPPNRYKLQCYRRVASAITSLDQEQGAAWAEERGEGPYGRGLYRRVATRWAGTDGKAAMTWLGTLPQGPELDAAVRETYRRWTSRNRQDASEWIAAQPRARWLEPAISMYALIMARSDPRAAIKVVEDFESLSLRDETHEQIARAWLRNEPEAARAWIETSELSEMAKARAVVPKPVRKRRKRREQADDF